MSKYIPFKVFPFLAMLLICRVANGQSSVTYTQYMDNPVPFNPAYSLKTDYGSVNIIGRKQWIGIPGAPALFMFNGDFPLA